MAYASASEIIKDVSHIIKAPERLSVTESARRHKLRIEIPGKTAELYSTRATPYMVEPGECMVSRQYQKVFFAGPAQSGKTFMAVELFIAYTVLSDPMDMIIIEKDRVSARTFVNSKLNRFIQANPQLANEIASAQADGILDKTFRSGVQIYMGWPSAKLMAGRSIGRCVATDIDRASIDVGGEGGIAAQLSQRIRTFGSRGKLIVESSPSRPVIDPSWEPPNGNRHIAPPTDGGIWSLYNTGDRRRLYGRCPHCGEYMLPLDAPEAFDLEGKKDALICTANGCLIEVGSKGERAFKRQILWVGDGQEVDSKAGVVVGDRIQSDAATFWMHGAFAGYQTWAGLLKSYRQSMEEYEATGNEATMKNVLNAEWCVAYIPMAARLAEGAHKAFMERAEDVPKLVVPDWARVLFAAVDVQKNRFEVLVLAAGPGFETAIISRFALHKSPRYGATGLRPAQYLEDWQVIVDKVVNATYRTETGEELRIYRTAVDMQGLQGVTTNALAWWRSLDQRRAGGVNLRSRVMLMRGGNSVAPNSPPVRKKFPDAMADRGKIGATRGDVPVYETTPDQLKDMLWADLHRETPGPRYIHIPQWMEEKHLKELAAEIRDDRGRWVVIPGRRNETFDLLYMCRAIWIHLGGDKIKWESPPPWARAIIDNSERIGAGQRKKSKATSTAKKDSGFGGDWF